MFIGHLPAGYILTKWLQNSLKSQHFLWVGLVASVLPDLDLIWFYLVDQGTRHHHSYWTHIPFYWLVAAAATLPFVLHPRFKKYLPVWIFFFVGILFHLFLDTIVGDIQWLYPLNDQFVHLFFVTDRYDFWVWNFVLHWSFFIELSFVTFAIYVFSKKTKIR